MNKEETLFNLLKEVSYPGFTRDIVSFGIVKDLNISNDETIITLELPKEDQELAQKLNHWSEHFKQIAFVIGGADGIHENVIQKANIIWSLSKSTFPHAFVRVLIAEQLYRAQSILENHPYHRE